MQQELFTLLDGARGVVELPADDFDEEEFGQLGGFEGEGGVEEVALYVRGV